MISIFKQSAKVDIRVIFRNGSSFEYTRYGTVEDLLEATQNLLEDRMEDWAPGVLYHFGQWSFDLSKVMALYVGGIDTVDDGQEVKNC